MNQYQWTFLDNAARRHTLGIAHSAKSGHLVVHCDTRVLTIDFSVLEPKSYSFFVEDELCHLKIDGSPQTGFTYKFDIDREVDTAVNRERKSKQLNSTRQDARKLAFVLVPIVLMLSAIGWWGYTSRQSDLDDRIRMTGLSSKAQLQTDGTLVFRVAEDQVQGEPIGEDLIRLQSLYSLVAGKPQGKDLLAGVAAADGLPVLYRANKPRHFIIDWKTVFANIESPTAPSTAAANYLIAGLTAALPESAGAAICTIRAAGQRGGYYSQLSLLDAYLLDKPTLRRRWESGFAEQDYGATLRRVCPPPDVEVPSSSVQGASPANR